MWLYTGEVNRMNTVNNLSHSISKTRHQKVILQSLLMLWHENLIDWPGSSCLLSSFTECEQRLNVQISVLHHALSFQIWYMSCWSLCVVTDESNKLVKLHTASNHYSSLALLFTSCLPFLPPHRPQHIASPVSPAPHRLLI